MLNKYNKLIRAFSTSFAVALLALVFLFFPHTGHAYADTISGISNTNITWTTSNYSTTVTCSSSPTEFELYDNTASLHTLTASSSCSTTGGTVVNLTWSNLPSAVSTAGQHLSDTFVIIDERLSYTSPTFTLSSLTPPPPTVIPPNPTSTQATINLLTGTKSSIVVSWADVIPIAAILFISLAIIYFVIREFRKSTHI